jgi:hypothetical protein
MSIERMAGPLVKVECRNKWMRLWLTQRRVSLALLSATVLPTPGFSQGTLEQRLACTPDVLRLCSAFIPNVDEITFCLKERSTELSDACRAVFEAGTSQLPAVGDSAGARNRAAR